MNDGSYREVKAEQDARPQKGSWAPGNYFCKCVTCKNTFLGDKRALECAPCAYGPPAMVKFKDIPQQEGIHGFPQDED